MNTLLTIVFGLSFFIGPLIMFVVLPMMQKKLNTAWILIICGWATSGAAILWAYKSTAISCAINQSECIGSTWGVILAAIYLTFFGLWGTVQQSLNVFKRRNQNDRKSN